MGDSLVSKYTEYVINKFSGGIRESGAFHEMFQVVCETKNAKFGHEPSLDQLSGATKLSQGPSEFAGYHKHQKLPKFLLQPINSRSQTIFNP